MTTQKTTTGQGQQDPRADEETLRSQNPRNPGEGDDAYKARLNQARQSQSGTGETTAETDQPEATQTR